MPGAQLLRNLAYQYDALGNITSNSEVGTYTYATGGGARPHALVSIAGQAGKVVNPAYSSDANGNILGVAGSNGVAVSAATFELVRDSYAFAPPRKVALKGMGEVEVYDLELTSG